jgi:hypothetical protein
MNAKMRNNQRAAGGNLPRQRALLLPAVAQPAVLSSRSCFRQSRRRPVAGMGEESRARRRRDNRAAGHARQMVTSCFTMMRSRFERAGIHSVFMNAAIFRAARR